MTIKELVIELQKEERDENREVQDFAAWMLKEIKRISMFAEVRHEAHN